MNRFGKWVILCVSIGALATGTGALATGKATGGGSQGAKAPETAGPIKVDKAKGANAFTVADTYQMAAKLDKKTVAVRGKVVKISKGIMGRNWVHLRDGSGDPGKGTNDLVATTKDAPNVGDVVTAKGILHKDKDFGSGYKYKVIVEDAAVKP